MKKIALVRLSSLGDIILCMASLQVIHQQVPDCEITWVTDRRFSAVLEHQPEVHRIVALDLKGLKKKPSWSMLQREFRALRESGPYDMVIDLHGMIKSAVVSMIMGGESCGFSGPSLKEPLAGLLYRSSFDISLELPAVSRYRALVANCLGIPSVPLPETAPPKPFLGWEAVDRAATNDYFDGAQRTTLIVPETSALNKNYPPEKFVQLALMLGGPVLVCHGNDRELVTARLIAERASNVRVLPRLTINQLKAAIGRSDLVIGGDSGPTHMAWASGVPSITLFGATPVCINPTEINLVIKTDTIVNLRKPDPRDFSVQSIPVELIYKSASGLLGRN